MQGLKCEAGDGSQGSEGRAGDPPVEGTPSGVPGGFTVLMSVYRRDSAPFFRRAVESVFQNTLQPDDFVLVVDGPIEGDLLEAVKALPAKVRVKPLEANVGLAEALNRGLEEVHTAWVARADADDYNCPDRFERQATFIRHHDVDAVGGQILEVEADGTPVAMKLVPCEHTAILRFMPFRNPMNHMTVMFRTEAVRAAGGYPRIYLKEDYGLWASLARDRRRLANLDGTLVRATAGIGMYRRRGGLKNALSEIGLQKHLCACGIQGGFAALLHGLARASVYLMPNGLRALIYEKIFRAQPAKAGGAVC
jgi:glycosyltransferase involved in cell wall biosynthesis